MIYDERRLIGPDKFWMTTGGSLVVNDDMWQSTIERSNQLPVCRRIRITLPNISFKLQVKSIVKIAFKAKLEINFLQSASIFEGRKGGL